MWDEVSASTGFSTANGPESNLKPIIGIFHYQVNSISFSILFASEVNLIQNDNVGNFNA